MGRTSAAVKAAVARIEAEKASDREFIRLRDFYLMMQRRGLVLKKEYDIPPIDTIGKTAFENSSNQTSLPIWPKTAG